MAHADNRCEIATWVCRQKCPTSKLVQTRSTAVYCWRRTTRHPVEQSGFRSCLGSAAKLSMSSVRPSPCRRRRNRECWDARPPRRRAWRLGVRRKLGREFHSPPSLPAFSLGLTRPKIAPTLSECPASCCHDQGLGLRTLADQHCLSCAHRPRAILVSSYEVEDNFYR